MENILELQQVSKTFSKSKFSLENVSFNLPYGAIMGFVGENGAGKTTTIGCILNTIKKYNADIVQCKLRDYYTNTIDFKQQEITEKSIAVFKGENPQMTIDKILRSQKFNQLVKEQTADYLKIDNH